MKKLNAMLLTLALATGTLGMAPVAQADKYVENNYYHYRQHDRVPHHKGGRDYGRGEYRHHEKRHGHHFDHRARRPIIQKQVIIVQAPGYYRAPRYYDHHAPRYENYEYGYSAPSGYSSYEYRSATPMILGGIIGGVIGNDMGKGRGRDVATAAGVILGGSIGRDLGR